MISAKQHEQIFQSGSRTYYNSARFFPPEIRQDVYLLYAFVRVADNFVDELPQNAEGFSIFCSDYRKAWENGTEAGDPIIDGFIDLQRRRNFDPAWTEAFLHSMELDLKKSRYETLDETLEYIYGSAEVIGLFMARIMGLPEAADHTARMLGRAMQYINFIRDIDEDVQLGRQYLPASLTPLPDITEQTARQHPDDFTQYIRNEIARYRQWQGEAETGYRYLPRNYLVPIKTAADMYRWTAARIRKDPFIVYQKKVKPPKIRILSSGLLNRMRSRTTNEPQEKQQ